MAIWSESEERNFFVAIRQKSVVLCGTVWYCVVLRIAFGVFISVL